MNKYNNISNLIFFLNHYKISNIINCSKKFDTRLFDDEFNVKIIDDERSAAYYACGVAEELNEAVVLIVDDSIASRNIAPGLTEAFYKQLPILVVKVCSDGIEDTSHMNDILKSMYKLEDIVDELSLQNNLLKMKLAFLDLLTNGCGPVQLNANNNEISFDCDCDIVIPSYYYKEIKEDLNGSAVLVLPDNINCNESLNNSLNHLQDSNIVVMAQSHNNFRGNYIQYDLNLLSKFDYVFFVDEIPTNYIKANTTIIIGDDYHNVDLDKVDMIYNFNLEFFIKSIKGLNIKFEMIDVEINNIKSPVDEIVHKIVGLEKESCTIITNDKIGFKLPKNVKHILNDDCKFTVSIAIGAAMVATNKNVYAILDYKDALLDINAFGNRCITDNLKMIVLNAEKELDEYFIDLGYKIENVGNFEVLECFERLVLSEIRAILLIK